MNNTVLVVTTLVAYLTSPCASLAKIGKTANIGVADCTINVCDASVGKLAPKLPATRITMTMMIGLKMKRPSKATIVSRIVRSQYRLTIMG